MSAIKAGKEYPGSFSTEILKRYLEEKDIKEMYEEYRAHCHHVRVMRGPNEKDKKVASLMKKERSYSKVAQMLGISNSQVAAACTRVMAFSGK